MSLLRRLYTNSIILHRNYNFVVFNLSIEGIAAALHERLIVVGQVAFILLMALLEEDLRAANQPHSHSVHIDLNVITARWYEHDRYQYGPSLRRKFHSVLSVIQ